MKKLFSLLVLSLLVVGCGSNTPSNEATTEPSQETTTTINVYTRDASSGTREAFEKAIGLEELTNDAIEVSSNGDMVSKVANDVNGIGYSSLTVDFESKGVVPVNFEGVVASSETVLDGTYKMQRPFSFVTRAANNFETDEKQQLVAAFIAYITKSTEGLQVIQAAGGEVDFTDSVPWASIKDDYTILNEDNSDITIVTAGSTSVEKTLTAALESFVPMAGNFKFTTNQTGSSDGYKRVLGDEKDGVNAADIGFASRAFKEEENVSEGLYSGVYCLDAVVVIVNKENAGITDLSQEQLKGIFSGEITSFSDLTK